MSSEGLGKFARAAIVSGLLGAAGLVAVAGPAHAQDNGTDNGTDSGTDNGTDNGTDSGTATTATTAAPTTTGGSDSSMPLTGNTASTSLVLGGAAVGIALAGRRLLAARS